MVIPQNLGELVTVMMEQTSQNGIMNWLPTLLLIVGLGLLLFGIVWTVFQLRASDRNVFGTLFTRYTRRADKEPDPDTLAQPELEDERCRRLEDVILMQKQQIASMERQLDDAAKLRHDFRQELLVLQEFARSGDRDALERYLPHVKLDSKSTTIPLCPNPLVNTILQFYFNKARAAGVAVDAAIQADEDLWLSAADAGVLLGNMLENGVTAAAEAPAGSRRLRIRTTQTKDCFVIAMGNTFGTPRAAQENGKFASTKPDHTGIGLNSIRSVALQYDGEAKFLVDGDMFMSYIILFRPYSSELGSDGGTSL